MPIGSRTKIKIVKNKVAPPFRQVEVDMMYGEGISNVGSILDMALERDIVKKSGAWFSYNDMRIGQGRENVKKFLKDNPTVCSEIESKLRAEMAEALASNAMPVGVTSNDDDDDDESTEAERIMDETTISDDELEDDLGF